MDGTAASSTSIASQELLWKRTPKSSPNSRKETAIKSSMVSMWTMLLFIAVSFLEFGLLFGVRFQSSSWLAMLVLLAAVPSIYGLGFAFASLVITVKEANSF